MQSHYTSSDPAERSRNRYGRRVGHVIFAVDHIFMNFGAERALHLSGGSAEGYRVASASDALNYKTSRLQPSRNLANVILAMAEAFRILRGSEPLVLIGRGAVLLLGKEQVKRGLLRRRGLGQQCHRG